MNAGKTHNGAELRGGDACKGDFAYAGAETSALCLASFLARIEFFGFPLPVTPFPFHGNHLPCQGQWGMALTATLWAPGCYGIYPLPKILSRVCICSALLTGDTCTG